MAGDIWCCRSPGARCFYSVPVQWKSVLVWVLLVITTLLSAVQSHNQGHSTDFSRHQIIRPKVFHGRNKREITTTKENDIEHVDVLTVGYELDGVRRILDLRLNTDLIPVGFQQRHQHEGSYKVHTPSKVELCHYQGSIRDVPGSWAAVSTCNGLKGVIFDGEHLHHIHPEKESLNSKHFVYKHGDLITNHTCGYDGTPHDFLGADLQKLHRASRHKRATEIVRGPYNANRQSRYVELVLVIDKSEYTAFHENLQKVQQHCKDIANIINAFYMPLNIFVALVGVEIWSESDEIILSSNGDTTLSNFLLYRRERLVKAIPNDNAQLLTRMQFDGGVVGKALKGPICTYEFSGGVSSDHSNVVGVVAATLAHEIGHNFGMEHDTPECECPEDRCIMAPSSGPAGPVHWSSCSLEYLALAFEHGMDYCLRNKPQKLFDSPICGNSFVEPGEQCDCGLKENCDNPCCDASTCMLFANASCATGQCCDLKTCRPKSAGSECRSAEHECDLPEFCSGQSEYCPKDVFKIDGESCNMGKAFCYQGSCRTHNDQCKLLWGPTGASSEPQCYTMNNKGNKNGNCGYNRIESAFVKCYNQDILCGMLHCTHLNERLEFGMESVAILSHSFINSEGIIIPCRSAIVDLGLNQVDPGLAPDGAKCATGKMCVNQKCMPVADLKAQISGGNACPNNCGGNGVCNSLGHCHCNRGWEPPNCTEPGYGGSIDSGHVDDPNARNDFVTALYIIFLGVLPTIALISLGVWYAKNSPNKQWKKGAISKITRGTLNFKSSDRSTPLPRNIETIDSSLSQDPACASLLPKSDSDERYNNNFFGHFRGFSITPIPNQTLPAEPTKPAPLPPTVPTVAIKTNIKPLQRINNLRSTLSSPPINEPSIAPALPPLNPGSTARPLISSPVLAATTCTSLELIGSKNKIKSDIPTRPAPDIPTRPSPDIPTRPAPEPPTTVSEKPPRPTSTPLSNIILPDPEKKPEKGSTLNRIASILRPNSGIMRSNSQPAPEKNTNSLPRSQHHKANKVIDKEILRNLEISNPIPQSQIEIPAVLIPVLAVSESQEKKNIVSRAQSMRDTKVSQRPAIHTFGSMRQTNSLKRPTSIPASARPTSPPPGPPKPTPDKLEIGMKIPGLPGYQTPSVKPVIVDNVYDDCMNFIPEASLTKITEESQSSDNIYAVIEESTPEKNKKKLEHKVEDNGYKAPKPVEVASEGASDSMGLGLLSEIVSEISNRNFDSIYSTSTIARKKKAKEEAEKNLGTGRTYINSSQYKSPESIYSNSESGNFNSASSTTSSGYLLPSAINIPEHLKNKAQKDKLSSLESKNSNISNDMSKQQKDKLSSLESRNPNISNDMSKQLGMKPMESFYKSFMPKKDKDIKKETEIVKKEDKHPTKPPLNKTKTPPNITKGKQNDTKTVSKSTKSVPEKGSKSPGLRSRQGSDTSLKSDKGLTKSGSFEKTTSLEKTETGVDKTVPSNSKEAKFSSPDVVSSCSNSNQNSTKSPDVLINNSKSVSSKINQKPSTGKSFKTPTMPPKPTGLVQKAASFTDKKKSPTANVNVVKSINFTTKEGAAKNETKGVESGVKTNIVNKIASSKSNVASLQQKFEPNKNINLTRSLSTGVKKQTAEKLLETQAIADKKCS